MYVTGLCHAVSKEQAKNNKLIIFLNPGHNRSSYPGVVQRSGWRPAARGSTLRIRSSPGIPRTPRGCQASVRAPHRRALPGPRRRKGCSRRGLRPQPTVLLRL